MLAHVPAPSPTATVASSASPTPDTPIRKIDFYNFTYPSDLIYGDGKPFTLKDGGYDGRVLDGGIEPAPVSLVDLLYGDVTGDGDEEALLVLFFNTHGTAIPDYVFVYGLHRDKPKLLWSFETGDRAQGGLRRVFAENGKLVLELYGRDTHLEAELYAGSRAACCADYYTRSRYEWKGKRFRRTQELEVLSAEGHGSYIPWSKDRKP